MEDDFQSLVGQVFTGLVDGLPDYAAGFSDADDVRAALKRSARLVLSAVFGDELQQSERMVWRVIGAQRARAGLRRESVAAAPTVVLGQGFEFILEKSSTIAAPGTLATAVLRHVWARLMTETAAAAEELLRGYDEQRSLDLCETTRPQLALVDRLLSRLWDERAEMIERGRRLGADITRHHGGLVILSADDSPRDVAAAAANLAVSVPEALEGPCRTSPRPHVVLLVPAQPATPWRKSLRHSHELTARHRVTVVTIEPLDPLDMLEPRYRRVLRSLAGALEAAAPGRVSAADLDFHWTLHRAPVEDRVDVVRSVLGPVLESPRAGELLDLLDALYETREGKNGAARALAIHPNTVANRKRLLHERTGLSPDVSKDAHRLFTARLLHKTLLASGRGLTGLQASV
ncbi:MAG: helix-turn-helix domain-containing protein [Actinomycetota bacterium]|nr:helix-turn-helix domain-containing protein [Actinomycetota bacterium]